MKRALHGVSVWHSNVVTQVKLAKNAGFDALEILPEHLFRYLENGGTLEKLKKVLGHNNIEVSCINALKRIGRYQPEERLAMLEEAKRICIAAQALKCPVVQIMALTELDHLSESERERILVKNITEIAEIGKQYGIKFQIEIVAFTQFNTLKQALKIIHKVNKDNVGLVIDFWHLHAGKGSTPDEVANLDKNLIYGAHFCDGRAAYQNEKWDEWVQRDYLPGEGDVDIKSWVSAVNKTGYDGVWAPELLSPTHWEDDLQEIANGCMSSLKEYGI